jgi:hypothetical protein
MRLDADLFGLSEKRPGPGFLDRLQADFAAHRQPFTLLHSSAHHICFTTSHGKTAWVLFEDNNDALLHLHQSGLKIHIYVGICDGCCEGGNWECVNENPFFGHVLSLAAPDGMAYFTDHSPPLQHTGNRYAPFGYGMSHHQKFAHHLRWSDFGQPVHLRSGSWRRERWTQLPTPGHHEQPNKDFWLALQAVLVRLPQQTQFEVIHPNGAPARDDQLAKLKPFRRLLGRGRVAEYAITPSL